MAWMTIDDKLHGHRKVIKLGADRVAALGVWTLCGSWAADHLTDGFVPAYVVEQWDPDLTLAARLVHVRLWSEDIVEDEDGYRFNDWCEYNLSREEIEAKRADAAERQRRSRDRRRRGNGTLGPDGGGPGSGQLALDTPETPSDVQSHATNGHVTPESHPVTRDSPVNHATVTPLPIPPPTPSTPTGSGDKSPGRRGRQPDPATKTAQEITSAYYDRVPLTNYPAVLQIVKRALKADYEPAAITEALSRLADANLPVSVNSLRIELHGGPRIRAAPARYQNPEDQSAYDEPIFPTTVGGSA